MKTVNKDLMALLGLTDEDFEPKKERPTIDDVVEALNVLADIVLESEAE